MARSLRISLAAKCQLLFGAAVLLIILAALTIAWIRMDQLVRGQALAQFRGAAEAVMTGEIAVNEYRNTPPTTVPDQSLIYSLLDRESWSIYAEQDGFVAEAVSRFNAESQDNEMFRIAYTKTGDRYYRYARRIQPNEYLAMTRTRLFTSEPTAAILIIQLHSPAIERQLIVNRIYLITAGLIGGLLAIAVFWFITTRIILSPVRVLRDTAEKISEGNLDLRASVETGDEFEQLSQTFNDMVDRLREQQDKLRQANKTLDLKLGELAESNVTLYEANRIKGEFLANVSHELRTPLNSITGFAEVLQESFKGDDAQIDEKRKRYASHIITSSRRLLELINDLLDLAKIEAGRVEVRSEPIVVADLLEALATLIAPQAQAKGVMIRQTIQPQLPLLQSDAGKLQQILFNLVANAVKFSADQGRVTLKAEMIETRINGYQPVDRKAAGLFDDDDFDSKLRISVTDTGPGIAPEDRTRIFEKFVRLDATVTAEHGGTGLGLTISRDLAHLLQGEISVESKLGEGSTFHLVLPLELKPASVPLMPDLA